MDLYENPSTFAVFLRLLHHPPQPYVEEDISQRIKFETKVIVVVPEHVIPLPILETIFLLVDKYAVVPSVTQVLHTHLWAHRSTFPLRVYGLATRLSLDWVANDTSMFLIHPPLHTYTTEQVACIPTVEAYHKLLKLQHYRETKLRDILLNEFLFPHGYGECSRHKDAVLARWDAARNKLVGRIESGMCMSSLIVQSNSCRTGTDVAAEMALPIQSLENCETCTKAWTAAVDMLAVSYVCFI